MGEGRGFERAMAPAGRCYASAGSQTVRIAENADEIAAAQRLRYQVFYEEMSARPTEEMAAAGRDFDRYDEICDHLIVVDEALQGDARVVGAYRLLRHEVARQAGGFYSSGEYDIAPLLAQIERATPGRQALELGRSCVGEAHRVNATIQLLWRGIAAYMAEYRIGLLFGCASLPGTEPDELAEALSYLHHAHRAPEEWRARALDALYVEMNRIPKAELDMRAVKRALPPLIKGYLGLGAHIGDGAVVDHQFGTTDVLIILRLERIARRYFEHFDQRDMDPNARAEA